jgi:hypothetical protein
VLSEVDWVNRHEYPAWLAKIGEPGVRRRAEFYCHRLNVWPENGPSSKRAEGALFPNRQAKFRCVRNGTDAPLHVL